MEYSELLKVIIDTSGVFIKEYSSALNYDASYISKWLHGVNLPVLKNSSKINSASASFFANIFWDSSKIDELKAALKNTEVNFPESFKTKKQLEDFLLKLFTSSYIESSHPTNKEYMKSVPNLPHLNAYVSDDLDEVLKLLHNHCKYMVHSKKVLQIYSTMPINLLTEVIASHNDSYCMLFRAKQVELNYFIPYDASTIDNLAQITIIANALKSLNSKSNIKLRYNDIQSTTQFVYTQGCYFLFRMTLGSKELYYLIDNPNLIKKYEIFMESLIQDSENAGNINTKDIMETYYSIKTLTESDGFMFVGDDFLLMLVMMSKAVKHGIKSKMDDELVLAIRNTMRTLLREKRIDFHMSESAISNLDILDNSYLFDIEREVTPEDIIDIASDFFFTIEGNEELNFHIYSDCNDLDTFNMNSLICDSFIRMTYFGPNCNRTYGDIMYSENQNLIKRVRDDLMKSLSVCIKKTFTPKEMYEFMKTELSQKKAD